MSSQDMNEKYGFETIIVSKTDKEIFDYAESLFLNKDLGLQEPPKNLKEALALLTYLTVEREFADAQFRMGTIYLLGQHGFEKDRYKGFELLRKSADQGNKAADALIKIHLLPVFISATDNAGKPENPDLDILKLLGLSALCEQSQNYVDPRSRISASAAKQIIGPYVHATSGREPL